jgi:hypothetical protein
MTDNKDAVSFKFGTIQLIALIMLCLSLGYMAGVASERQVEISEAHHAR